MPQEETIVLTATDRTAEGIKSANRNLSGIGEAATRASTAASQAGKDAATTLVSVTNSSQAQINKIADNVERRLNLLKSPLERLQQQQGLQPWRASHLALLSHKAWLQDRAPSPPPGSFPQLRSLNS